MTKNPQQRTSTPISFAAAAQKNTSKASLPTPSHAPTQPQAPVNPTSSQPAASQTQPSTAPTSSPGSYGAAVSNNSTVSQKHQQPASKPATTSTANGNYSTVAANRRPQAPVWPVTSTGSGPATSPASGSSAPPIRFGSFGGNDSAPPPAVTEVEPSASATGTAMTFGSIPASQPIPAKPEEVSENVAP
ncbi:MAG: hypothetical protein J3Q66DRAFT_202948 [Benniella sp.]|nr:MAG: hypothetical protein J3Q66DRAFT_202948 [Benniella sp.]